MALAFRHWLDTWLQPAESSRPGPLVLGHRRVFILPSSHGYLFMVVLVVMLAGSVNYSLSLGFVLTFLLGSLAINGIIYTYRNLANLRVSPMRTQPVFAGENALFPVRIENPTHVERCSLEASIAKGAATMVDVSAHGDAVVTLEVATTARGRMSLPRITLQTKFPLGLFRAWSYALIESNCVVYPRPEQQEAPLPAALSDRGGGLVSAHGTEDFAGLRAYHPGDSPRRIAWKADARDQGLLTKVFSGQTESTLWLDWSQLPSTLDVEGRLSRLTRWVLTADAEHLTYGIRLPTQTIDPGTGSTHRTRCLEALALYQHERPA
jgi:uncharacterized protein (DUF58 family)